MTLWNWIDLKMSRIHLPIRLREQMHITCDIRTSEEESDDPVTMHDDATSLSVSTPDLDQPPALVDNLPALEADNVLCATRSEDGTFIDSVFNFFVDLT